jgi:SAM-dependent methyltransferase
MDQTTLAAYDRDAAAFAREWETQPAPSDLYEIVRRFFAPGPTADIGCGSGRDTAWLGRNGFAAIGYDASERLLAEARRLHRGIRFQRAALPGLHGIGAEAFTNVLCETVIMHLAPDAIIPSVERLLAILRPGGTLYLSWRVTEGADKRDEHGRLYAAFDPALVFQALASSDLLLDEQRTSLSSGKVVRRVVARKVTRCEMPSLRDEPPAPPEPKQ